MKGWWSTPGLVTEPSHSRPNRGMRGNSYWNWESCNCRRGPHNNKAVTDNLQPSKEKAVRINIPTSLTCQCLPLTDPNQKPENKADQLMQSLEISLLGCSAQVENGFEEANEDYSAQQDLVLVFKSNSMKLGKTELLLVDFRKNFFMFDRYALLCSQPGLQWPSSIWIYVYLWVLNYKNH